MNLAEIWQNLTDGIWENELFKGAALAGLLVSFYHTAFAYLRRVPGLIYKGFDRYCCYSIVLAQGSNQFLSMSAYLADKYKDDSKGAFVCGTNVNAAPLGRRFFFFKKCLVVVDTVKRELEESGYNGDAVTFTLTMNVYGRKRKKVADELLKVAEDNRVKSDIYYMAMANGGWWENEGKLPERKLETVVSEVKDDLIEYINEFVESKEWYKDRGLPHRTGILLAGPPGTGKSSLILAIAHKLRRSVKMVNLLGTSSKALRLAFSDHDSLFVIEDIDASGNLAHNRELVDESDKQKTVSLSDLLNSIDGITSGSGNILICTSNNPDVLDAALVRPGRIDRTYILGYLTQTSFDKLCEMYYGRESGIEVPEKITAATVQCYFLGNKNNFNAFIEQVKKHGQTPC